jgi:hypothetical protein
MMRALWRILALLAALWALLVIRFERTTDGFLVRLLPKQVVSLLAYVLFFPSLIYRTTALTAQPTVGRAPQDNF